MAADDIPPDMVVDTRGMFCPAPIIKLSEAIRIVDAGRVVEIVSDDPAIEFDLPAWCNSTGHAIVTHFNDGNDRVYRVRKAKR
jgi:tRNA 2-thiouridine synthesizing protein A